MITLLSLPAESLPLELQAGMGELFKLLLRCLLDLKAKMEENASFRYASDDDLEEEEEDEEDEAEEAWGVGSTLHFFVFNLYTDCLLYTSPSPRD